MIETIPFAIGFIVYVLFCLFTFEIYSKSEGMTHAPILFFIYSYYSILAWYVINLVESDENFVITLVQIMVYLISCGMILLFYYKNQIKPHDEALHD